MPIITATESEVVAKTRREKDASSQKGIRENNLWLDDWVNEYTDQDWPDWNDWVDDWHDTQPY